MSQIYNTGNIRVLNQMPPSLGSIGRTSPSPVNTGKEEIPDWVKRDFEEVAYCFDDVRRTAKYLENFEIISPEDFYDYSAIVLGGILNYCLQNQSFTFEATAYKFTRYIIDSRSPAVYRKIGVYLDYWSKAVFVEKPSRSAYRFLTWSYNPQTKKYSVTIEPRALLFLQQGAVFSHILKDYLKRKWIKGTVPTPTSFTDFELGEAFFDSIILRFLRGYDSAFEFSFVGDSDIIAPTYANRPMARFLAKILDYCLTKKTMEFEVKDFQTLATQVLGYKQKSGEIFKTIKNYLDFWSKTSIYNLFIPKPKHILEVEYLSDKIRITIPCIVFRLYRVCGFHWPTFENFLVNRIRRCRNMNEERKSLIRQLLENNWSNELLVDLPVSENKISRILADPRNLRNKLYTIVVPNRKKLSAYGLVK